MSKVRAFSSPELNPQCNSDDSTLEGVSANLKLLLKLIHDHNEASNKADEDRKPQRVAGMINIISDVKTRIEKLDHCSKKAQREAQLRRCNTELRRAQIPTIKKPPELLQEENQRLRKELSASMASCKSLEKMFSSLGKEKEIMAMELARKVHEINGMEELIHDLKAQNEILLAKVQSHSAEHTKEKIGDGEDAGGSSVLQERNKLLSYELIRAVEGCRLLNRRLKDTQEENRAIQAQMAMIAKEVATGHDQIHNLQKRFAEKDDMSVNMAEELSAVECMLKMFKEKVVICGPKTGE